MSNNKKTVLITGVRGQDGTYLAEHLFNHGYTVIGTSHAEEGLFELPNLCTQIEIRKLDLSSEKKIKKLVADVLPVEIYNLAARSSSSQLFDDPIATADINGLAAVRFLEAIRDISPYTRFCQAASSELYAGCDVSPQDENTAFSPNNAYGAAKAYAANMVTAYRSRHGIYATTAILFNHESPRRGTDYVTRKITHAVAKIAMGHQKVLILGNLDSRRDWGFAGDYALAMWLMLQQSTAEDYVIATGITHSVRDFCEIAFSHVGLDYRDFVQIDSQWARRSEVIELRGNPTKARDRLNWQPSVGFADLVRMMVDADLNAIKSIKM
jgi:GDPmannose 4,6-dehydratase